MSLRRCVCLALFFLLACTPEQFGVLSDAVKRPLSPAEVAQGLKEALSVGTDTGVSRLAQPKAFLAHALYRIAMPPAAKEAEQRLRALGLGKLCDQAITSMNTAAEQAIPLAKPIVLQALRDMTVSDAMGILRGHERAATEYFQKTSTSALVAAFRPKVSETLAQVSATAYWDQLIGRYNSLPLVTPVKTDLTQYVTEKTLFALFEELGQVEAGIRQDPLRRTTDLLKRVFGAQD